MKRRKWDSKVKSEIVIQGLKGKPVSEICTEHEISQAQYYQWRDQFLSQSHKTFESKTQSQIEARLKQKNKYLTQLVGELTAELKKSDEEFE